MKKVFRHLLIIPLSMILMFALAQTSAFDVSAANNGIARIGEREDAPKYTGVAGVNQAIRRMNGEIKIYMLDDWGNERLVIPSGKRVILYMQGHAFDRGLSRQSGKGWQKEGENIYIEEGASLTINGGPNDDTHRQYNIGVHNSTDENDRATHEPVGGIYGGVIAGGDNTNGGGGITAMANVTLTLNQVTIAGCRSEETWSSGGYGGGIWVKGENTTVRLNDSRITGCQCQNDGGGIYTDRVENVRIEMVNSMIDHNYARSDGGGINPDGEKFVLKGDEKGNGGLYKSRICYNEAKERGGGIYLWNDNADVSKLFIDHNKAADGGGIYLLETKVTLSELQIKNNENGGIYIANKNNTLSGCSVTGNSKYGVYVAEGASETTLNGNTVIKDNPSESGRKNLLAEHGGKSHFKLGLSMGADIHIDYNKKPEDINDSNACWSIAPYDTKVADYRQFFTSDDDNYKITYSYDDNNGRSLNYTREGKYPTWKNPYGVTIITGDPVCKPVKQTLNASQAATAVVGRVDAGGTENNSGEYSLIRGYLHHEKTDSGTEDTDSVFYYSDAFFFGNPYVYNSHLATASWNLAFGGTYLRSFEERNANNNTYYNKHAGARQFLADIGVPDQNIYVNDSNINKPGTDSIGVIIGSKHLVRQDGTDTGYILVPVAVRGGGYEAEWASNVKLGSGQERAGEAQGFSEAADQVMSAVEYYISRYELEDELAAGKVKFWVSGFSRAGATANLTSKRLVENYASGEAGRNNQVFAYPCEAAKGGTDKAETLGDKAKYYCIHNLINAADIVPLVGPEEMGFKRYGVDHYIPGTEVNAANENDYKSRVKVSGKTVSRAGSASSDGTLTVTTYTDNEVIYGKLAKTYADPANDNYLNLYAPRRLKMLEHLSTIDSTMAFNDYFLPQGVKLSSLYWGDVSAVEGSYRENFIIDFLSFMQEKAVYSRKTWAEDKTKLDGKEYGTIQQAARDSMALLFSMSEESKASATERASAIAAALSYFTFSSDVSMRDIFDDVIGDWHTLSDTEKLKYINYFWRIIDDSGALDFLPEGEAEKLEYNWPTLANLIFTFIDGDWDTEPVNSGYSYPSGKKWITKDYHGDGYYMVYTMSLMQHVGSILASHYPEIDIAWARTYDSYYSDADGDIKEEINKEYSVKWTGATKNNAVPAPAASVRGDESGQANQTDSMKHAYIALKEGDSGKEAGANRITDYRKIYLEVGNIYDNNQQNENDLRGEAIYYTLQKVDYNYKDIGEPDVKDVLYRGGVDIMPGSEQSGRYKLTAYAMSYGDKSPNAVYYLNVDDGRHNVYIKTNGSEAPRAVSHKEGETVTISAETFDDRYFKNWTVTAKGKGEGAAETNVTAELLGSDEQSKAGDTSISFTMPAEGADSSDFTWPEDYSLTFTANYENRISQVTASPEKPVTGTALATTVTVSFDNDVAGSYPVSWIYSYEKDGQKITVPVKAGDTAYESTAYTAVITIPKNTAEKIVFADSITGHTTTGKDINVTRNAEGDAEIRISFEATASSDAHKRPDALLSLTITAYDLNSKSDIDGAAVSYMVSQNTETNLTAPDIRDELFNGWDFGNTNITLAQGSNINDKTVKVNIPQSTTGFEIKACYIPVVSSVEAIVDIPVGGKTIDPSKQSLIITITNSYKIHPDYYEVVWTPQPATEGEIKRADYLVPYTATVRLTPKETDTSGGKKIIKAIKIDPETGEETGDWLETYAQFNYSEALVATVNGENASPNISDNSLSYTFPETAYDLKGIMTPDPIDIANGGDVKAALPSKVKIVAGRGIELSADVEWSDPILIEGEEGLESSVWQVRSSKITLPEGVDNRNKVSLIVFATVNVAEAPTVSAPRASVESGAYRSGQIITLSTSTDDAEIYYTINDTAPTTSDTRYEGEEIFFSRDTYPDGLTIRAVAVKEGMRSSAEAVYVYELAEDPPSPSPDPSPAPDPDPDPDPTPDPSPDDDREFNTPMEITTLVSQKKSMVTVKWNAVSSAEKYRVAYRKAGSKKWKVKTTAGNSYRIKKLKKGALYQVKVAPVKGSITGKYSKISRRYLRRSSSVRLKAGSKSIKVTWKKISGVTGYKVYYSTSKSMKNSKVKNVKGAKKTGCTIKSLKRGRRYYVKVVPYKLRGGYTYKGSSARKSRTAK